MQTADRDREKDMIHLIRYRIRKIQVLRQRTFRTCITGLLLAGCMAAAAAASEEIIIGLSSAEAQSEAYVPSQPAGVQETASQTAAPQGAAGQENELSEPEGDWFLLLVNKDHPIPDDYVIPELTQLSGGNSVDSRIYPYLQRMFDDARSQGIYPHITSSYRTMEKQQQLMDDKIQEYLNAGNTQEEAVRLAEEWVAIPGTSEHQLGLSVDISADESSGQDPGSVWYWLQENSASYGFVKRYPEDKTEITGIINEPWHYRFVGLKAAAEMTEKNLCLEEYLAGIQ